MKLFHSPFPIFASLAIALCLPLQINARDLPGDEDYAKYCFTDSSNVTLPYRMLKPEQTADNQKYPMVIFLHGCGERGSDNEKQLTHGSLLFSNPANEDKYPAYVVFPQCEDRYWTSRFDHETFIPGAPVPPESEEEKAVMGLIDELTQTYPIDTNRIYIMGISMGGIATYDLVCRYPDVFAAAVPICGAVNPDRLSNLENVSFMIFQGEQDREVPIFAGREAYKALKAAGTNVEYVEFAGADHEESWIEAFNYQDLLPWLFSQTKN